MNGNTIKTITISGKSEGIDKLIADINKLAAAEENVAVVSEKAAKRQLSLEAAWKQQTLRLDENARAQNKIANEVKVVNQALDQQKISAEQAAQRIELINKHYATATVSAGNFTKTASRQGAEMLNLSRQFADVGVSLQAGQSPFTVLVQQGAQIADVFAASGRSVGSFFSQAAGWAARFVVSTAGVVTGLGAIAAGALYAGSSWADAQREIQLALIGIGKNSGVTAKDINELASSGATAFGLSVGQAREAALEFVRTGVIYRDNIKAAVAVTHDFAIVTGTDAKEAAKTLATALADPVRGADELNKQIGFLDGKTREYIITLVNQNQLQEAQGVLLRNLAPTIAAATNTLGPFEKAWAAVANQAERFKNAVGKEVLSTPTDQEQLQQLIARRDQPKSGVGLFNQSGNLRETQRINEEIERLSENMRETARATAFTETAFKQLSIAADDVVRSVIPQVQQIQALEGALGKLKAAQEDSRISGRQGLGESNQAAINAIEVQLLKLKESRDEADRYNERVLTIAKSWGDVGISTALALDKMQGQLLIAQAITGQQQLEAQYLATINSLLNQGKTLTEATAVAEMQRAISLAQVNAQAERTLQTLRQEGELLRASSDWDRSRIRAAQTYNKLIQEGVDSSKAGQIAAQMQANERATEDARDATVSWSVANDEAGKSALRMAAAAEDANYWIKQAASSMFSAGQAALMANTAFVPFSTTWASLGPTSLGTGGSKWQSNQGGISQFNPAGYTSTTSGPWGSGGQTQGQIDQFNKEMFDTYVRSAFGAGGAEGAIAAVLQHSSFGSNEYGASGVDAASTLQQLTNLLPEEKKAGSLQQQIAVLQQRPATLANMELMKQLNDQLASLTRATEDNTGAQERVTDVLSPFYSSDPRRTHLGFRAFAGGGIMTQYGELPLKQYQGGGIATSPQVAVFGEGSTPEAYVPAPAGRIPVELKVPANSNQRPINVTINVMGNADANTVNALKTTSFQQAQALRRISA